jgi:HEPN domain-containing protein
MKQEEESIEQQIARAFYIESETDLNSAEILFEKNIYSRSISMSQQVVEKSLKAILAIMGLYRKQHEMLEFFVKEFDGILDASLINEISILAKIVESEWVRSRYPNWEDRSQPIWIPSKQYSKDDAEKALSVARKIHEIIKDILESKFQLKL